MDRKMQSMSSTGVLTIRWLIVVALIGLGVLADASPATLPAHGAAYSDQGRDMRLNRAPAQREQGSQPGISSPASDSRVSGAVPILGTASGESFARYELYYKQDPSGDEAYIWFAGDTRQVNNGQLGVWHTGDLAPGTYTLRMRVVRPNSNYREFFVPNISVNQATPTPDAPTETPIPIDTPTPFPQPTAAPAEVEQPNIEEPTSTPEPLALGNNEDTNEGQATTDQTINAQPTGILRDLGETLTVDRLRARFFTGVRWSAGLFLLLGAIFAAKRLLQWLVTSGIHQ